MSELYICDSICKCINPNKWNCHHSEPHKIEASCTSTFCSHVGAVSACINYINKDFLGDIINKSFPVINKGV